MIGAGLARALTERVSMLERTIRLYRWLHDRLKYMQPSVMALIDAAYRSGEFKQLRFLTECHKNMKDSGDFSESWRHAVENSTGAVGEEAAAAMASLSDVLGKTDLESQLAAIDYGSKLLEQRLQNTREYAKRHQRLYRTLGVLAGALVAVLIV